MAVKNLNKKINLILFLSVVILFIGAVGSNYVRYYQYKNFNMSLEDVCDPSFESCFVRECSEEECPPNRIEIYKYVDVPAYFFEKCENNTCHNECISNPDSCEFTFCDPESEEDVCFIPEEYHDQETIIE